MVIEKVASSKEMKDKTQELQENLGHEPKTIKIMFFKVSFDTIINAYKKGVKGAKKVFNRIAGYLS